MKRQILFTTLALFTIISLNAQNGGGGNCGGNGGGNGNGNGWGNGGGNGNGWGNGGGNNQGNDWGDYEPGDWSGLDTIEWDDYEEGDTLIFGEDTLIIGDWGGNGNGWGNGGGNGGNGNGWGNGGGNGGNGNGWGNGGGNGGNGNGWGNGGGWSGGDTIDWDAYEDGDTLILGEDTIIIGNWGGNHGGGNGNGGGNCGGGNGNGGNGPGWSGNDTIDWDDYETGDTLVIGEDTIIIGNWGGNGNGGNCGSGNGGNGWGNGGGWSGNDTLDWDAYEDGDTLIFGEDTIIIGEWGGHHGGGGHHWGDNDSLPGCGGADTTIVDTLSGSKAVGAVVAFEALGAGSNIVREFASKTGIESTLQLYPNPVAEELRITLNSKETATVQVSIFNLSGQQIAQNEVNLEGASTQIRFDLSNQPSGIYFVNVRSGEEILHQTKFMKQ